ncbi:MAG: DUF3253 domain-containing protein [Pseudomonadota bacterium]
MTKGLELLILHLCQERGPGKTICPSEVARAVETEEAAWRRLLPEIRRVASDMARDQKIAIYRKGRVIDPDAVKGVIRLGLPPRD